MVRQAHHEMPRNENFSEAAISAMEEREKKRERKKRERMPMHGAALKQTQLQQKRSIEKIIKILRKTKGRK